MGLLSFQRNVIPKVNTAIFKASFITNSLFGFGRDIQFENF